MSLESLRIAAYYIAERSGFQKGAQQCWFEAEQELRNAAATTVVQEEIFRAAAKIVSQTRLHSKLSQFEFVCKFQLPNACCICENLFDNDDDDGNNEPSSTSSTSTALAGAVVPFCKLEHLCKRGCRERVHFQTLQLQETKEYIVSDLFAAFLKDPTFGRYDRVCRDCFERSVVAHVENPSVAFYSYRTRDGYWSVQVTCPFCHFSQRSAPSDTAYSHLFRNFNPFSQDQEEEGEEEDQEEEERDEGDDERPRQRRKHRTDLLHTDLLLSYLREDARAIVQNAIDREYDRRNSIKLHCPVTGCEYSSLVAILGREGEDEEEKENNTIDCPEHGLHCTLCWNSVERDAEHLCHNLPQSLHDCPENIRRCPKCMEAIYRTTGCDSMTCARCNTEFDWKEARHYNANGVRHDRDEEQQEEEEGGEEQREEEETEKREEGEQKEREEEDKGKEETKEEGEKENEEKEQEKNGEEERKEGEEQRWWSNTLPGDNDPRVGLWRISFEDTPTDTEIELQSGGKFFQKAGSYSGTWRIMDS